ncbi:sulfotransferase family protein [Micromonospora sp. NPDC050795]|uniref:sulfotransferase family protein n=1 Tax=Micromonospora sp. NPDC050795 TaxID=3364282 RepID=UPI00378E7D6E
MLSLVVGTGRCGSTLVQELLSRHPAVGFVSGLDDKLARLNPKGRFNGPLYRRSAPRPAGMTSLRHSRRLLERGRLRVAPSEAYHLLDRQVLAGFSRPCRDLVAEDLTPFVARRLRAFFDERIARQGCQQLVQHVTGWPRTGLLHAAYPELRVVNVVRDGRAVANSWLQMGWWDGWRGPDNWIYGPLPSDLREEWAESGRSFQVLAALGWKMLMDAFAQARLRHPADQWLDVRYEDLVEQPREQVGRMLDFLGLGWSTAFEKGFSRYDFTVGRAEAYRDELSPAQLAATERVLEKSLAEWGYPVYGTLQE